jgi:peptide/nickel transport system permease protein
MTGQVRHPGARGRLGRLVRVAGRRPSATVGAAVLFGFGLLALLASPLAGASADAQVGPVFAPPSGAHLLGLDDQGADVLKQLVVGTRVSILVATAATLVASVIGGAVGLLAGYLGGWVERALMALTDYFILVPALPLMIVVAQVWGPDLWHSVLIIGMLLWTPMARVTRAEVKVVRTRGYVLRAVAMGASRRRIIWKHVLPQVRGLLAANAVLIIAAAVFAEAALAFLGVGDPETVSWGAMIQHASERGAISQDAWWAVIPPGVCIALVVVACNLVSLAFDVTARHRHGRGAMPPGRSVEVEYVHG